jgi:hypothetical protein
MNNPVTLQISLAPTDLPHARHILPHQLRQWGVQVDEILLTVDLHRSRGKFAEAWEDRRPGLLSLVEECCAAYPHASSLEVDYGDEARAGVAEAFFGGRPAPLKDYRGAPLYSYLFSMHAARHDHVFHLDSDMLFGGGATTWVSEALGVLAARPDVLACNPLPGPPHPEGILQSQLLEPESLESLAFRSSGLSTRLFLLDRRRLAGLPIGPPDLRRGLGAWLDGNPRFKPLEELISDRMAESGWRRVDFLGEAPGMWSVHPPWRSAVFYERLPSLIAEIERGDVPEAQLGCHDVEDCMVDWTGARPTRRRRIESHTRLLLNRRSPASARPLRG